MEREFWMARWARDEIGFHQPEGNDLLKVHWPQLGLPESARVLVPLCGKTPDMAWLAACGHEVVGVELSDKAARAFFDEQGLQPETVHLETLMGYRADGVTIWVGDFFALPAGVIEACTAFYDRASLIALPPVMRARFAETLCRRLPAEAVGLLISIAYPDGDMQGPPFSVPGEEVRAAFTADFTVTCLESRDALAMNARFRDRGVSELLESAYALRRA